MQIDVSIGEILDKVSILKIKTERILDETKNKNVRAEHDLLIGEVSSYLNDSLFLDLLNVNKCLWDIEDALREKERNKEFDDEFIALARSVYITNDKRFAIKNDINNKFNSQIREEKSYTNY